MHHRAGSSLPTTTHARLWFPQWQRPELQHSHGQAPSQALTPAGQRPSPAASQFCSATLKDPSCAGCATLRPLASPPGPVDDKSGSLAGARFYLLLSKPRTSAQSRRWLPLRESERRLGEVVPHMESWAEQVDTHPVSWLRLFRSPSVVDPAPSRDSGGEESLHCQFRRRFRGIWLLVYQEHPPCH